MDYIKEDILFSYGHMARKGVSSELMSDREELIRKVIAPTPNKVGKMVGR